MASPAATQPAKVASARGSLKVLEARQPLPFQLLVANPGPTPVPMVPFTKSRLSKVQVFLEDLGGQAGPQLIHDLSPSQFDFSLFFSPLGSGNSYRITLKAWQPANLALPDQGLLEAQDDANSRLDFALDANQGFVDLDGLGGLVLTLKDRDFQGTASGGIQLQEGSLSSTTQPEGLAP